MKAEEDDFKWVWVGLIIILLVTWAIGLMISEPIENKYETCGSDQVNLCNESLFLRDNLTAYGFVSSKKMSCCVEREE